MKIYISGAISGADNYEERFRKAEEYLTEKGWEVLNPTGIKVDNLTYEQYMELDLKLLDYADAIYMLEGWENSKGANREYGYALAKDKLIVKENLYGHTNHSGATSEP